MEVLRRDTEQNVVKSHFTVNAAAAGTKFKTFAVHLGNSDLLLMCIDSARRTFQVLSSWAAKDQQAEEFIVRRQRFKVHKTDFIIGCPQTRKKTYKQPGE